MWCMDTHRAYKNMCHFYRAILSSDTFRGSWAGHPPISPYALIGDFPDETTSLMNYMCLKFLTQKRHLLHVLMTTHFLPHLFVRRVSKNHRLSDCCDPQCSVVGHFHTAGFWSAFCICKTKPTLGSEHWRGAGCFLWSFHSWFWLTNMDPNNWSNYASVKVALTCKVTSASNNGFIAGWAPRTAAQCTGQWT